MIVVWTCFRSEKPRVPRQVAAGRTMTIITLPSHPGDVLQELYLLPLGMSAPALARHLLVPRTRIERLIRGETALNADMAMRLATCFRTSPEYWMNLQLAWDLARARETVDVSGIVPIGSTDHSGQAEPGTDRPDGETARSQSVATKEDLKGLARGAAPNSYRDQSDRT